VTFFVYMHDVMTTRKSAKNPAIESVERIEPARLEEVPEALSDIVAELSAAAARLEHVLNPRTAANLADLVRIMNTYYSNLIEGHNTRPIDIARALAGKFDKDKERRNLQLEAAAHVRVQAELDLMADEQRLPEPSSSDFIRWLHREFYRDAPKEMLLVQGDGRQFLMKPGEWRSRLEHDVAVGRHAPPSSDRVADFMTYFETRYRFDHLGKAGRVMAMAAAHHRFNYIHPFPDGNGRVSRLMSHAMAHCAGIGAHGLWSISRGLARGLKSRREYKEMMDLADTPRQGDLDGRGNLSQRALIEFTLWFLRVCLDQVTFMSGLFELETLARRLRNVVERSDALKPEAAQLLEAALFRGEFERGDVPRITGLPERTARRVFADVLDAGLLGSTTPKGSVSLRFPADTLDVLFPRLFSET
jgi:Fic family protein